MNVRLACALFCFAVPVCGQKAAPAPSLLDKLYRLIWPAGRFKGDLLKTVTNNTQKGGSNLDYPQLYIVVAEAHSADPWKQGMGAIEPVICAQGPTLYYRRGPKVIAEPLLVSAKRAVSSGGKPIELISPAVRSLIACGNASDGSFLWIQNADGDVVRMTPRGNSLVPAGPDPELSGIPPRQIGDYLRIMPSLRPDGFTAAVLNNGLAGQRPGQDRFLIVDSDALQFSGTPAWVPGTDSLFVVGQKGAEP